MPWAIYMYKIMKKKIYVKSEFKADLLKLTANVQSDNSFLRCSKFTPLELSAPAPKVKNKLYLASSSLTIWSIIMKLHKNDQSNKTSIFAYKFCHLRLSALAQGLYTCTKSCKNLCKIRVQSNPSETYSKCLG